MFQQASAVGIVGRILSTYQRFGCDGLFLPAVSHDGIQLPVAEIVRPLGNFRAPKFVAVDGAQAIGHLSCGNIMQVVDFYLASTHKWLGSGLPLGIAVCGTRLSRQKSARIPDPLFSLTQQMTGAWACGFGETVNAVPLVTGFAAIQEHLNDKDVRLNHQQQNRTMLTEVARTAGWSVIEPDSEFRTGIVLIHAPVETLCQESEAKLTERFQQLGIAVTCYAGGFVRLSAPISKIAMTDLTYLHEALRSIANGRSLPAQSNLSSSWPDVVA
ncbi:MAG: aminotransferase class V-fold PLP-dependent enzyme [Pirellulales bacterium]|nr:aminotransferase class V-fold PLP-dependent enzyme [Pirellulales bacterium]